MFKQCGQVTTIRLAPTSLSTSTFCAACIWYRNSLPARRAGSPVQVSPSPRTMNSIPAVCSNSATALVVRFARSSYAPAQPTQNRYSTSAGILSSPSMPKTRTGNSTSSIQVRRPLVFIPQGLPLVSKFLNRPFNSAGNSDSTRTW